ncbi:hypothetical protein AB0C61_32465 [Streptomyces sp. NPDC048680]|uniref:hypothetical protein n=1 Tax=Streptomyces sp. NPDC048680 TaxID=3155492 RepID=UPI00343C080D
MIFVTLLIADVIMGFAGCLFWCAHVSRFLNPCTNHSGIRESVRHAFPSPFDCVPGGTGPALPAEPTNVVFSMTG